MSDHERLRAVIQQTEAYNEIMTTPSDRAARNEVWYYGFRPHQLEALLSKIEMLQSGLHEINGEHHDCIDMIARLNTELRGLRTALKESNRALKLSGKLNNGLMVASMEYAEQVKALRAELAGKER